MATQNGEFVKAQIKKVGGSPDVTVTCMFNPKQYVFSKTNSWTGRQTKRKNVPVLDFGGGQPSTLSLELLFDTYEKHSFGGVTSEAGEDVRKYTKGMWDLMKVSSSGKKEPPHCTFSWGSLWSFEAVIESIKQTFTLFLPDGTPVRATLDVSFKQVKDEGQYPPQNPTSGGNPGEHLRTVIEGETLSGISFEEYGDATVWRHLAEANNIQDPRRLTPGQVLIVTPLPLE